MSGSADAPAATEAAAVSSAGFASAGRRRCVCGAMCFVALERRRARDTSLPDWCEIQDSDYTATLVAFGSKCRRDPRCCCEILQRQEERYPRNENKEVF